MKLIHKISFLSFFLFTAISCNKELSTTPEEILGPNIKLFVESDPPGARIFLDNKNTGHLTPDTVQWLQARNYKLTLKLELFKDTNVVITVNQAQITKVRLDYTRNPNMRGTLYCDTNPRGAEVFLGDSSTGKFTPVSIANLYPGLYTVKFKKEGYWDDSTSTYVESAKTRYATVNLRDSLIWVRLTTESVNFPSDFLTHVAIESGWIKWVSTLSDGLIRYDDRTYQVFNETNSPLPSNTISMVGIDDFGKKWICTNDGLAVYDDVNWTIYNTSNSGIPGDLVSCVAFDIDGSVWVGTANKGLAKFDGGSWTVFNTDNSALPSNNIKTISIDLAGTKWFGTGDAGLAGYNGINWKIWNIVTTTPPPDPPNPQKPGIPTDNVQAIAFDPSNIFWIGLGLQEQMTGGSASYPGWGYWLANSKDIPSGDVKEIAIDVNNIKWFANANSGLSKYTGLGWTTNDGAWTHYNTSNSGIGNDRVFSIAIDANNHKWLATFGGGLVKYKGN